MIKITQKGDFSKTAKYLGKLKSNSILKLLNQYGEEGVAALSAATPVDTGKTANSWRYEINHKNKTYSIIFYNDNIVDGIPIAIILQYGHATRNGGWVEGKNYINPAIQPTFDKLANDAWREVTSL